MKTETIEVYKCDYCNKLYQRKHFAEAHEKNCSKNPSNFRKCMDGCTHLTKESIVYYFDTHYGEDSKVVELLYCNSKECFVYPAKVENDNKAFDLGDIDNNPMPIECEFFKK